MRRLKILTAYTLLGAAGLWGAALATEYYGGPTVHKANDLQGHKPESFSWTIGLRCSESDGWCYDAGVHDECAQRVQGPLTDPLSGTVYYVFSCAGDTL